MRNWNLYLEVRVISDVPAAALGELGQELELFDAVVAPADAGYSAQLTVLAEDLPTAVSDGVEVLTYAAARVALPAGEIVVIEGRSR